MKRHGPMARASAHVYRFDEEYLLYLCDCGRQKSADGTRPDASTGARLKHDQRRGGCRACNRQFTHSLPEDLDLALEQAAFEVGYHHGLVGLPEWTQATKRWWGRNFYMAAYEAGYGAGEADRVEVAA